MEPKLRLFRPTDYHITDDDIKLAIREQQEMQLAPRPYGTWTAINLWCAICQQEMESIRGHKCAAAIACTTCYEVHPIWQRGCD